MKVKNLKNIVIASLLFSNFNTYSFANSLTEDRFEAFSGNNSFIDNTLDENIVKVDSIEGNSLVNVLNYSSNDDFTYSGDIIRDNNYIEINSDGNAHKNFFIKKEAVVLKPSTEYTFVVEIDKNTLTMTDNNVNNTTYGFVFGKSNDEVQMSPWTDRKTFNYNTNPGRYTFTLTTKDNLDGIDVGDRGFVNIGYSGILKFRYMIIEGNHVDKDFDYFRGIQSVGEDKLGNHSIKVTSSNRNLLDVDETISFDFKNTFLKVPLKKGKYFLSYESLGGYNDGNSIVVAFLRDTKSIASYNLSQYGNKFPIELSEDANRVYLYSNNYDWLGSQGNFATITKLQLEEGTDMSLYEKYTENSIDIKLKEPLRGLPNGVSDRIIRKNGEWVVERNCVQIVLDGETNSGMTYTAIQTNDALTMAKAGLTRNDLKPSSTSTKDDTVCDKLTWVKDVHTKASDSPGYNRSNDVGWMIKINLPISDLGGTTVDHFNNYLKSNPISFVVERATPVYEVIDTDLSIMNYKGATHIRNNSNIPLNLNIIVDRTLNRVTEAIESAKINPTQENISIARMWINLLEDSTLKDELQDDVNDIINLEDFEIDRKTASANIDLYIKSENTLSMSLSTNSVTFDNYSAVEDSEKLNAVELNIHSSLPYTLNSYLEGTIKNSDGTATIDSNALNIKEQGVGEYKAFSSTINKIVLNETVEAGNNNIHKIDLKLSKDNANKADVYKTTIKFEAIQK